MNRLNLKYKASILLLTSAILLLGGCTPMEKIGSGPLLKKNKIELASSDLDYWDIEGLVKLKPNRKFLGIFQLYRGAYRWGMSFPDKTNARREKSKARIQKRKEKGKEINYAREEKRVNRGVRNFLMNTLGEAPVFLDSSIVEKSTEQIALYCRTKGYFAADVSYEVIPKKHNKSNIVYSINPGTPYRIRNFTFNIHDATIKAFYLADRKNALIKPGMIYDEDLLDDERTRIVTALKDQGYYYFSTAYIVFEADSALGTHEMDIRLVINRPSTPVPGYKDSLSFSNHKRCQIHRIFIYPDFLPALNDTFKYDTTLYLRTNKNGEMDSLFFVHRFPMRIKEIAISRKIFLKSGSTFRLSDAVKTQNGLSDLGSFRYINLRFSPVESNDTSDKRALLDAHIELTRVNVHSFSTELEGTNSAGNLGVSGNIIYVNRNLFSRAEKFNWKVKGGLEMQKAIYAEGDEENKAFIGYEIGSDISLLIPRFLLPVNQEKFSRNTSPNTRINAGINYQERADYRRFVSNLGLSYQWRESATNRQMVSLFPVNLVRIFPDSAFAERIAQLSRTLRTSYEDHLIAGLLKWNFIYSNQGVSKKKRYSYFSFNFEEAGSMLRLGNLVFNDAQPDQVFRIFDIRYAQYIRADADFRTYFQFNNRNTLALRSFIGVGIPYGNIQIMPFEKGFSAGGSNDIRAWGYRSLGPGSYGDTLKYDKSGDIGLVLNAEYRFPIVSWFKGALFCDAGNVWLKNATTEFVGGEFRFNSFYKQLAVGAGFGLRLDFSFFIFRVDAAFPLRDPSLAPGERWLGFKNFNKHTILNFGIGYPF